MEYKEPTQRVQRPFEHIGNVFEEISWAFADVLDIATRSMTRFVKKRRTKK